MTAFPAFLSMKLWIRAEWAGVAAPKDAKPKRANPTDAPISFLNIGFPLSQFGNDYNYLNYHITPHQHYHRRYSSLEPQ